MDHKACGPARSSVNNVNGTDTSGRSKCKRATGVLVHGASDATQTSCDSFNIMVMILLVVKLYV